MQIMEISINDFENFSKNHILYNFHQSINYALLKAEEGYEYDFIGGFENNELLAASLIIYKRLGNSYYGYAPRGFLMDYSNPLYVESFTNAIIDYYKEKNFAFIKINPEIAIATLNKNTKEFVYNENYKIIDILINNNYKKLKNNMYFESLLPRINVIINTDNLSFYNFSKNTKNKIRKAIRKGLTIENGTQNKFDIFYEFIKDKTDKEKIHYNYYYNVFKKNDKVDLLLVKINYEQFLINSQKAYDMELIRNSELNEAIIQNSTSNVINEKMNSDKTLLAYKNDIAEASKHLLDKDTYIAGALIIKDYDRITVQISGFNKDYNRFAPNYYLYYAILSTYKNTHKYIDLNGITADMSKDSPYHGLNNFKLGFNPNVYEFIGEFDLIIDEDSYNHLLHSGLLAKEFNK